MLSRVQAINAAVQPRPQPVPLNLEYCTACFGVIWQVFNPFVAAFGEEEGGGDTNEDPLHPLPNVGGGSTVSSILEDTTHHTSTPEEATSTTISPPAAAAAAAGAMPTAEISASASPPAGERAQASSAATFTTTTKTTTAASRTLGEEEKDTRIEPACRTGGGFLKALPANVGLMTLMRETDGVLGTSSLVFGPKSQASADGKLTILVSEQEIHQH